MVKTCIKPFYSVREYRPDLYKVCKFSDGGRPLLEKIVPQESRSDGTEKLDQSYSRAKRVVLELALCNDWEYFFTGTIDGAKLDRCDLDSFRSRFAQFVRDRRKRGQDIKYLIVPELHADLQAWHVHGLVSGVPVETFETGAVPRYLSENYLNWCDYADKFGFCSLGPVQDPVGVAFYVSKYVTKELADRGHSGVGDHLYFCSRGLQRSQKMGDIYEEHPEIDSSLSVVSPYCQTCFVTAHWSDWMDICSFDDVDLSPFGDYDSAPLVEPYESQAWRQMDFGLEDYVYGC